MIMLVGACVARAKKGSSNAPTPRALAPAFLGSPQRTCPRGRKPGCFAPGLYYAHSNKPNQGDNLAEREGFEPPVELPPHLISSQTPSTELGHLSTLVFNESLFKT